MSEINDDLLQKLVAKTLEVERGLAHEQNLPKTKRQTRLHDEIDKFLDENFKADDNDN